jgi:HAE1 family hydrophobic/amphiphilic exporter-1/multidrug efflux pump
VISKFFIERPVFSIVISIVIVLAGLIAIKDLPIQEYPAITPPTIMVRATYPDADAQTLSKTVAAPLEEAINGVENMIYISSTASPNGDLSVSVTFKIGTDPVVAKVDVNNRVQLALNKLPEVVSRQGVMVRERTPDILNVFAFTSKNNKHNTTYITNYLLVNVLDDLKRVPGVGDVHVFGSKDYSIRVWLKPDKLASYGLSPADVVGAIRNQNEQFAAGRIGQEPIKKSTYTYSITTRGRLKTAEEFENIIMRSNSDGSSLRLKDVARIELGSERYFADSNYNGQESVAMGIWLSSGANALEVSKNVGKTMKELSQRFPSDLEYHNIYDIAKFIKTSIKEVIYTLLISILLAIIVIYIFLGTLRATTIPALAIPVSIIGTFAGFYAAGFSINLLTLFGLILAIGLVVDDAIIVIENTDRISKGEDISPKDATIKSMKEITSPIVAIVLVLDAVFIPASFVGGFSGKMYQQFALTIATSVTISGIVALTLTPALCALILRKGGIRETWFSRAFYSVFNRLTKGFTEGVRRIIKFSVLGLIIFAVMIGATVFLSNRLPTGLVPEEDKGDIMLMYYLMPASSLKRTIAVQKNTENIVKSNPDIVSAGYVSGIDLITFAYKTDSGVGWVHLKDWSKRKDSSWNVIRQLMMRFSLNKDAYVLALNVPPIRGMSVTGGFAMYVQDRTGGNIYLLDKYVKEIVDRANKDKKLMMVRSTLNTNVPQYKIKVNREKAKALNVPIADVFTTLQSTFGTYYVNDFNLYGRTFHVNMQSDKDFRENLRNYDNVFVKSRTGKLVPVSSLVSLKRVLGTDVVQRFNMFTAANITGQPRFGYTSGDAMNAIQEIAKEVLPKGYTIAWSGTSYQEKKLSESGSNVFIYTAIFVLLILAALYESFTIPFAIMLIVPFAIFGAVLGLWLGHLERDIYFNVGVLVLMGLSAKNAILMVKFALQRMEMGYSLLDATVEGAKIRFRPIVMTSLVFILASSPLIFWGGAGASSRHIIGTTVVSGMLLQTIIGTLFVPLFFYFIMKFKRKD